MCELASFIYKDCENYVDIKMFDLESHGNTWKAFPQVSEQQQWFEGHYKPNGDIELRTPDGRNQAAEELLYRRYPTFAEFIWGMFVAGILPQSTNRVILQILQEKGIRQ